MDSVKKVTSIANKEKSTGFKDLHILARNLWELHKGAAYAVPKLSFLCQNFV